jgi:hypothetical protein
MQELPKPYAPATAFQVVGPGPRVSPPLTKERVDLLLRGYGLELNPSSEIYEYAYGPDLIIQFFFGKERSWAKFETIETFSSSGSAYTVGGFCQTLFHYFSNPTWVRKEVNVSKQNLENN